MRAKVAQVATEIAHKYAADVDRDARFPQEALAALKSLGALGAAVPEEFGGWGCSVVELTEMCVDLGRVCSATAMVFAMHQIQVISLAHHAHEKPNIADYLRRVATEQRLIASGTSEVGPSGDMRQSVCHVERIGDKVRVQKHCTTMSYVQHADDILIQARRSSDSAPSDQMLVLGIEGTYSLQNLGSWDTLGMRGTCSPGGVLTIEGESWQAIDIQFGEVASVTMSPTSHILWGGLWLGIAKSAEAVARSLIRAKARKNPGQTPPEALELSRLSGQVQLMESNVMCLALEFDQLWRNEKSKLAELSFGLRSNNLKLTTSEELPKIVGDALRISGIMAYKNDTEFSLGRQLRDSYSCALMVNNQRIHSSNAATLLVLKGQ